MAVVVARVLLLAGWLVHHWCPSCAAGWLAADGWLAGISIAAGELRDRTCGSVQSLARSAMQPSALKPKPTLEVMMALLATFCTCHLGVPMTAAVRCPCPVRCWPRARNEDHREGGAEILGVK